jgi:hypothetical protein
VCSRWDVVASEVRDPPLVAPFGKPGSASRFPYRCVGRRWGHLEQPGERTRLQRPCRPLRIWSHWLRFSEPANCPGQLLGPDSWAPLVPAGAISRRPPKVPNCLRRASLSPRTWFEPLGEICRIAEKPPELGRDCLSDFERSVSDVERRKVRVVTFARREGIVDTSIERNFRHAGTLDARPSPAPKHRDRLPCTTTVQSQTGLSSTKRAGPQVRCWIGGPTASASVADDEPHTRSFAGAFAPSHGFIMTLGAGPTTGRPTLGSRCAGTLLYVGK